MFLWYACSHIPPAACGGPAAPLRDLAACSDTSTSHSGPWVAKVMEKHDWGTLAGIVVVFSQPILGLFVHFIFSAQLTNNCKVCVCVQRNEGDEEPLTWQHWCPGRHTGSTDTSSFPLFPGCGGPCTGQRSSPLITCRKDLSHNELCKLWWKYSFQ